MRVLSTEQLDAVQREVQVVLEKYGLTAAYLVAEMRRNPADPTDYGYGVVIEAQVKEGIMSPGLKELSKVTYEIMSANSQGPAPRINDN